MAFFWKKVTIFEKKIFEKNVKFLTIFYIQMDIFRMVRHIPSQAEIPEATVSWQVVFWHDWFDLGKGSFASSVFRQK